MAKLNKVSGAILAIAMGAALLPAAGVSAAQPEAKPEVQPQAVAGLSDQIIVKFKAGKSDVSAAVASNAGANVKKSLKNGDKVLKVKNGKASEALAKLQADPNVEYAEIDHVMSINVTPNDPSYASQYHLPKIQAPQAWDYQKGSTAVKIAIVDTGVDLTHPDLSGKIIAGYNFVSGNTNANDDQGHGTHCAGIATASTNNSKNGAGVDWNARIMPVKVLNSAGSGYTSDIIDGVYWAADHGANVISMSLGGGAFSSTFQTAINYAWSKGAVIVAAAGNNGNTAVQYPANYSNVLSVAATTSTDAKASFSTYGTWVDIAAPGNAIYSTARGGGMTTMSGTSMATPVVAGVAGLVWARYGTSASPATIVNKINSTADKITGTGSYWINGRVNAYKAVTL
ncbi:thermitase [Tumebacillus sp. BK434]|uniref:S8 family peptidase n=1 Tax=Tumebacillus sp. BK434 TaxID=2512169 RepID=UPI00104FDDBB|nr:S8 family peptidase [Tumebacillus sp. BK434]TCP58233.1 thermitase [Tumebacillus sp. BK434]